MNLIIGIAAIAAMDICLTQSLAQTPNGPLVYQEDFSVTNSVWNYTMVETHNNSSAIAASYGNISGGTLNLKANVDCGWDYLWSSALLGTRLPNEFAVDFSLNKLQWCGYFTVMFFQTNRISDTTLPFYADTTFPFYEVNVFGNQFGDANFNRNPTNATTIANPVTTAMNDGQWYNWRIEKMNNSLRIYVNNSLQYSYNGALFSGGYLVFTSRYAGSTAKIDNLRIYDLSSPALNIHKAVYLDSSNLTVGSNYQFQVSSDLVNWTNQGAAFPATNSYWRATNYWNVENWDSLFFRLNPQ